jgi:hypothetical protein
MYAIDPKNVSFGQNLAKIKSAAKMLKNARK